MNKKIIKIIDADALIKWVNENKYEFIDEGTPLDIHYIYSDDLIKKIKKLATPAEPQLTTPNFNELLKWIEAQEEFEGKTSIFIEDLKEVVSKITEPQQSIYDADGWCDDLDLAPKDGTPFFIRGGYFNSATRQIHGHENDCIQIVFYKEKINPDVDSPYTIINYNDVNIDSPTSWAKIIYPKNNT